MKSQTYIPLRILFFLLFGVSSLSAQNVTFIAEDASAAQGSQIEYEISVRNFTDVTAFEFALYWPTDIIEFVEVVDADVALGSMIFTSTAGDSALLVSWSEPGGLSQSVADNTILLKVRFNVIGNNGDTGPMIIGDPPNPFQRITAARLIGGMITTVPVDVSNGSITVTEGGGNQVRIYSTNQSVDQGTTVCVPVRVDNFNDVTTLDLTFDYDQNVLTFDSLANLNLPGLNTSLFNTANPGRISLSWSSPASTVNLPNGSIIYEACFTASGPAGSSSPIDFTDGSVPNLVGLDTNGVVFQQSPITSDGRVSINFDGTFDGLELVIGSLSANENASICVPVVANNFDRITSFAYQIDFDPTKLRFDSISNIDLDFLNAGSFNTTGADTGAISTFWFDNSPLLEGVSVPNGSTIFTYCFTVIGECPMQTEIRSNDDFPAFEALDSAGMDIPFAVRTSEIDIICGFSLDANVSPESCMDECDGAIELIVNGGVAPFTITWDGPTAIPQDEASPTELCDGTYEITVTDAESFSIETTYTVTSPNTFMISNVDVSPVTTGNNGAIDITITGGSGSFSYQWSTSPMQTTQDVSGLMAGNYTVTITDTESGCTIISSPIEVTTSFSLNTNITSPTCNGGSDGAIQVTPLGGSGNYTYEWSCSASVTNEVQDIVAGDCVVTVTDTDNGMMIIDTITVTEPEAIQINPSITDDDGTGIGAIDLNPSGGTPPYTFSWSNGSSSEDLSGLSTDIYLVTITDQQGCTFNSGPIAVTDGSLLIFAGSSNDEYNGFGVSCNGVCDGFIDIQVFGGQPPYTIEWSQGSGFMQNDLCPGTYGYTVTDANDDSAMGTIDLEEPEELEAVASTTCSNGMDGAVQAILSGGAEPYLYSWNGIDFISANEFTDQPSGDNMVFIRDANGCELMLPYRIPSCDMSEECYEGMPVITPNGDGRNDLFVINCVLDQASDLEVFDRFGRLVYMEDNYSNTWQGVDNGGNPLDEDTYIWVLRVRRSGQTEIFNGTVSILRTLR